MSKILTKQEMVESVMKCLEESVSDLPKEEREEAKAAILGAFSKQMFYGKKELKEDLKNRNINIELFKSATMLRQQAEEIERLKEQLEDCTCQGGHSQAYLKVKGKK